jgi:hypothetical protein
MTELKSTDFQEKVNDGEGWWTLGPVVRPCP